MIDWSHDHKNKAIKRWKKLSFYVFKKLANYQIQIESKYAIFSLSKFHEIPNLDCH